MELVGVWRLVSCVHRTEGRTDLPFGPDPSGYLIYTPDGFMAVGLMARNRSAASDARFQSYSGRYTYEDGTVTHHIEFGFLPSDVGTHKVRHVELRGEDLVLTSQSRPVGQDPFTATLVWRRAGSVPG